MHARFHALAAVILLYVSQVYAANFTFSYGDATQCGNFSISWTGGTAPFQLALLPPLNGRMLTFSIPASSVTNGQGSYQVQLPFPQNESMIAVMSDASGFASGGISDSITIGPPVGHSQCNTTAQPVDFFFDADMALNQCRTYSFTNYTGGVQPVTIMGLIPGGSSFVLNPPVGSTSFDWITDLATGTSVVFVMQDSKGRQGGSTQVEVVGETDDNSCLTGAFPSSLAVHPSATYTSSSASQRPTATPAVDASKSSVSSGTIAGAVVGGVIGLAAVAVLAWYLLRKNRSSGSYFDDGPQPFRAGRKKQHEVDLANESGDDMPPPIQPYPLFVASEGGSIRRPSIALSSVTNLMQPGDQAGSTVYSLPNPYPYSQSVRSGQTSDISSALGGVAPGLRDSYASSSIDQTVSSGMRRKGAMAGAPAYQAAPRFIMHTDAEEVIELPPQYSSLPGSSSRIAADGEQPPPADFKAPLPGPSASSSAPPEAITTVLEEDDQMATARLQEPLSPGPPSSSPSATSHSADHPR